MADTDTSSNPFSGLPVWVKAVAVVGFPSALSMILLYVLLAQTTDKSEAHFQEARTHISSMDDALKSNRKVHADTLRILQGLCLNAAKTGEQQARCLITQ